MEDIGCIFCKKSSDQITIEENGYIGRKCLQCGLIFISPRPTFSEMLKLYQNDKGLMSAGMHISGAFEKRLQARHNIRILENYTKKGTLLEIGAGAGYFLDEARKEGFKVHGIEPNETATNFILNNFKIPCESIPLNESSFGGMKFDIIYHCNVLSHLFDPIEEFRQINNKLNPNDILAFETGNTADVNEKYYKFFGEFGYPDHLFFFGENSIKTLLDRSGFEIIKIYRYSILPYLMVRRTRDLAKGIKSESTGKLQSGFNLKKFLKSVYRIILYFIRYKIGYLFPKRGRPQTVFVVARKKCL